MAEVSNKLARYINSIDEIDTSAYNEISNLVTKLCNASPHDKSTTGCKIFETISSFRGIGYYGKSLISISPDFFPRMN